MRPDGSLNPCVEQFRKYKHTELNLLETIFGARRDEATEPVDLVAQMARIDAPETVEPVEPPANTSESDR